MFKGWFYPLKVKTGKKKKMHKTYLQVLYLFLEFQFFFELELGTIPL